MDKADQYAELCESRAVLALSENRLHGALQDNSSSIESIHKRLRALGSLTQEHNVSIVAKTYESGAVRDGLREQEERLSGEYMHTRVQLEQIEL
ncbi:unnamed protein product [Penicillium glandicola]